MNDLQEITQELKAFIEEFQASFHARLTKMESMKEFWRIGGKYPTYFFNIFEEKYDVIRTKFGVSTVYNIGDFFPIFDEQKELIINRSNFNYSDPFWEQVELSSRHWFYCVKVIYWKIYGEFPYVIKVNLQHSNYAGTVRGRIKSSSVLKKFYASTTLRTRLFLRGMVCYRAGFRSVRFGN